MKSRVAGGIPVFFTIVVVIIIAIVLLVFWFAGRLSGMFVFFEKILKQ